MEYILPSHIFYYDAEKTKIMVIQYTNNKVYHNLFGPAWIKYNKYGKVVFLKQIGGTQTETSSTIALSKDGNYFYVSGQTNGTTSFDGHNITTVGLNDIFIAKYAVDGTYQWVHDAVSGVNQQIGGCFTVDNNDNIVIGGELLGVTDFYGGIISLTGGAVRQIFISKFDSNGNTLWAKLLTGANASNVVQYVNADALGYYFTGNFLGTMAFDVKSITSSVSGVDGFIYKTNLSGNGIWVRQVAGVSSDILISSKFNDNLYVLGYTNSVTLTIDSTNSIPSALTYPIIGGYDIVTFAYDSSGTLQYARRYGSSTDERAFYIDANANHVLLGGEYTNPITSSGILVILVGSIQCPKSVILIYITNLSI